MSVVVEMFWLSGWGNATGQDIEQPTSAVFADPGTRALLGDVTTEAVFARPRTRAALADNATSAAIENPDTSASLS